MLLTRAPLYSGPESPFLVRLACVRHAASVDSEPGSNSRLNPVAPCSFRTEVRTEGTGPATLENVTSRITSENDQTKLGSILTTGMFNLIVKDPKRGPPERVAGIGIHGLHRVSSNLLRFSAHFLKLQKSFVLVKYRACFCPRLPLGRILIGNATAARNLEQQPLSKAGKQTAFRPYWNATVRSGRKTFWAPRRAVELSGCGSLNSVLKHCSNAEDNFSGRYVKPALRVAFRPGGNRIH